MNIGFYAGSFDPFTNGHLYVIKTASKLFDKVIIGIGTNTNKSRLFGKEIMKTAMEQVLKDEKLSNCECVIFDNLQVDVAKAHDVNFLVRGLRNATDYPYEENLAKVNKEISNLDTLYIRADKYGIVSSSMVRELLSYKKDVSKYLPRAINSLITK